MGLVASLRVFDIKLLEGSVLGCLVINPLKEKCYNT